MSVTLAASIVAEKADFEQASKLQSKINKQRLLEEEKRVQQQLRILQVSRILLQKINLLGLNRNHYVSISNILL